MDIPQISPLTLKNLTDQTDKTSRAIGNKLETNKDNALKNKELKKACIDFEALILNQMISRMREGIPKSGLFDNSYAHGMYQSLHDQQLASNMAESGGIGLADKMYKQLTGQIKSSTGK